MCSGNATARGNRATLCNSESDTAGGVDTLQLLLTENYVRFSHMCTADLNVLNDHAHSCKQSLQQLAHNFKTQLANTQKNDKTDNQHTHKLEIVPSRAEFINPLQP